MDKTQQKTLLYEQVARLGKSLASPRRLELLELLAQGEKSVDTLVAESGIEVRLTSAHLKALREARLVVTRRAGRYIHYRLSGPDVAQLVATLRRSAELHLPELHAAPVTRAAAADR